MFKAKIFVKDGKPTLVEEFFVVKKTDQSLLGKPTSEAMQLLKVGLDVHAISEVDVVARIFPKAPGVVIEFEVDETVIPRKAAYYRVPIAVQELVEEKLDKLLDQGIIERVTESTRWISPLIVAPKGNMDIRICVDMRNPKKAIKRVNHPLPVIEDFLPYLGGARIFSRLDITSAFHHLELSPRSRELTTFLTRRGLMRYTRLLFGVNCAPELFQRFMEEVHTRWHRRMHGHD